MGLFSAPKSPSLEGEMGRVFRLLYGYSPEWNERGKKTTGYLDNFLDLMTTAAPQYEQAILGSLQQTAPQVAQLQADLFRQYAPQYAQTQVDAIQAANPEFYAQRSAFGQDLMSRLGQGLSPQDLSFFSNQLAEQQASRGLFDSPLSSVNSARTLTGLDLSQRQQNIGNLMNYLNNYSTIDPSLPNIGLPQLGGYQTYAQPSVQDLFGQSSQNRMTKVGGGPLYSSIPGLVGTGLGLALSGLGGGIMAASIPGGAGFGGGFGAGLFGGMTRSLPQGFTF